MAPTVGNEYKELLNPVKDPEQSFAINISELLQSFVKGIVEGKVPADFNSAALLLQGSSSIYGKKVEYLHNLATKLYASLVKNKKEAVVAAAKKDNKDKEKHAKEGKFNDPFFSTEIKPGKNLSCLRKKAAGKSAQNKKSSKKSSEKKYTFVPVDLLPLDGEERGDVFYDTRGDPIGNKKDFTLNKCKVVESGWLLLPTVSPNLVPNQSSSPDYSIENGIVDDNMCNDSDSDMPESTPMDEGYPPSSGFSGTPDSAPSSQIPSSQGTDEGLGSLPCTPQESQTQGESAVVTPMDSQTQHEFQAVTPMDGQTQPVSETNTPIDGSSQPDSNGDMAACASTPSDPPADGLGNSNPALESIENILLDDANMTSRPRRSMRQALKLCQLAEAEKAANGTPENDLQGQVVEEMTALKRAIQKKNTCSLPTKLQTQDENCVIIYPASEFCARTFFSMDGKFKKNCVLALEVPSFENNSTLWKRFKTIQGVLRTASRKKRKKKPTGTPAAVIDEDDEADIGRSDDPGPDLDEEDVAGPALEADDIVIENTPVFPPSEANENAIAEEDPMCPEDIGNESASLQNSSLEDSFNVALKQQVALFKEDLLQYVQTSDISERVYEWESVIKPFLEGLDQREAFDINLYGSRILNSFEDSNRKQTLTFRNFCKGKQKWEIHRYFMALLPLVNIGNVSIEADTHDDGGEDILVTLLSRKMHHKELEEFGHTDGEHS